MVGIKLVQTGIIFETQSNGNKGDMYAGGQVMQGLYNRRCEEADMFSLGDYSRDL